MPNKQTPGCAPDSSLRTMASWPPILILIVKAPIPTRATSMFTTSILATAMATTITSAMVTPVIHTPF